MSLIARELKEVWDALRASNPYRDEALEEVRIRKLRGIWDLRLPFEYPVSVLAGPNACGKSTVLFACACAYRVPERGLRAPAPGRLFPDFSSRQPAVGSDAPQETELEFHYLHRGDRLGMVWRRGRSWSRKGDTQPERQVYLRTLANLTNPAEVRSILQLGKKEVRSEALGPELLMFAHRVLPWHYRNLALISDQSNARSALRRDRGHRDDAILRVPHVLGGTHHSAHLEGHLPSRERPGPDRRGGHRAAPPYPAAGDARTAATRPSEKNCKSSSPRTVP